MVADDVIAAARTLRTESAELRAMARNTRARIGADVMAAPFLRALLCARGGSDDGIDKDKALAPLMANPGVWYCVACWARAAGLPAPQSHRALRAYAHRFANNATPGALCFGVEQCAQPAHQSSRLALCVRVNPPTKTARPSASMSTEDALQFLRARLGLPACPQCGEPTTAENIGWNERANGRDVFPAVYVDCRECRARLRTVLLYGTEFVRSRDEAISRVNEALASPPPSS